MTIPGITEEKRLAMVASSLKEMKGLAHDLRDKIASQPPRDLLGYIYAQRLLRNVFTEAEEEETAPHERGGDIINEMQFLLEYVHAAWASIPKVDSPAFDEALCGELFEIGNKLQQKAMMYAMMTSAATENGTFGPNTGEIEFRAKSNWLLIRGNRYQALEGEFFNFVLEPHDQMLRDIYGVGSVEVSVGFQDMATAQFRGHADAAEQMMHQFDAAQASAKERGQQLEEIVPDWAASHADDMRQAFDDMLRGGVCNVSRHTSLPSLLLADLAFERGEETDFFDDGPYSGTPFRTLPARKKPLIRLDDYYYAVDPCFTRDAGYRALLWNLLQRKPEYKEDFEIRQKEMSEAAFFKIFAHQLRGAKIHQEVYYKNPSTNQWVENDTLILIDDVLILVEAKAGAAATIASPELDFQRHAQSVQDLVVKAYQQCKRFFDYLQTADEVPIFNLIQGRYVECGKVRRADYRLMLPIGLTVESFSPFSAMCKELPDITPILGQYPFISISIDDLFLLNRLLPTMGELAHYLEVRQIVAGMKGVNLFDEMDHLGAYLKKNRFDMDAADQMAEHNPTMMVWDGMSAPIDEYFAQPDWENRQPPRQDFPDEVASLFETLEKTNSKGWLSVSGAIRDYDEDGRKNIAKFLSEFGRTLNKHPHRYFSIASRPALFVWLQRAGTTPPTETMQEKARAAALAANATDVIAVVIFMEPSGRYISASRFYVSVPPSQTVFNAEVFKDAERMKARVVDSKAFMTNSQPAPSKRPGRNERCWCGSGLKFKKCHGG